MIYPDVSPAFRIIGSLLFGGLTMAFQGLTLVFAYETISIFTRKVPTISLVTAFEFLHHPTWGVTIFVLLGFTFGALVTHFTHWTP